MDQPIVPAGETQEQRDIRLNKDMAAFGYVWIMSIPIFLSRRDSPFIRYHSKQGLVLFLLSIPIALIPFIGKFLLFIVAVGMLMGFMNAAQGRHADVPIVGELAKGELKVSDLAGRIVEIMKKLWKMVREIVKPPEKKNPPASPPISPMDTAPKPPVP